MRLPKLSPFQLAIHVVVWIPLALIVKDAFQDNLTANPIQDLTLRTGKAALWLLVFSWLLPR
jgi:DMSO/TMAO reductase YedYZ heme-binding membrane subunit